MIYDPIAELRTCVGKRGQLLVPGRAVLESLRDAIDGVLKGHDDNTGSSCRIDLMSAIDPNDGHDSCYLCDRVGAALRGVVVGT